MKSVAIVGVGAVGAYYGCRMVEAGWDVRFLLRSDYPEVSRDGFRLASKDGDFEVKQPQVFQRSEETVSYTHLTLPTIYSV